MPPVNQPTAKILAKMLAHVAEATHEGPMQDLSAAILLLDRCIRGISPELLPNLVEPLIRVRQLLQDTGISLRHLTGTAAVPLVASEKPIGQSSMEDTWGLLLRDVLRCSVSMDTGSFTAPLPFPWLLLAARPGLMHLGEWLRVHATEAQATFFMETETAFSIKVFNLPDSFRTSPGFPVDGAREVLGMAGICFDTEFPAPGTCCIRVFLGS
jgi:hypothetical protein